MRAWQAAFLALAAALTFTGSAASTHDPKAPFAGTWTLDPRGRPGELQLRAVSDAVGRDAFATIGLTGLHYCDEPTQYYKGIFTTPNDRGLVVGCTWPRVLPLLQQDFSGYFKSTNFAGDTGFKGGKLNMPSNPPDTGIFEALVSRVGGYSPLYGIEVRFAGHFEGDGHAEPLPPLKKAPLPLKRGRVSVPILHSQYAVQRLEVATGTVLTICNHAPAFREPFTLPKTGPNAFRVRLKPGACMSRKLVNTGTTRITVHVFDFINSRAKLSIVIHPRGV